MESIQNKQVAARKGQIRPRKPTRDERLITLGFLNETAERCDQLAERLCMIHRDPESVHVKELHDKAAAIRAVADWIRPDSIQYNQRAG
jgi:hypothetical protein